MLVIRQLVLCWPFLFNHFTILFWSERRQSASASLTARWLGHVSRTLVAFYPNFHACSSSSSSRYYYIPFLSLYSTFCFFFQYCYTVVLFNSVYSASWWQCCESCAFLLFGLPARTQWRIYAQDVLYRSVVSWIALRIKKYIFFSQKATVYPRTRNPARKEGNLNVHLCTFITASLDLNLIPIEFQKKIL